MLVGLDNVIATTSTDMYRYYSGCFIQPTPGDPFLKHAVVIKLFINSLLTDNSLRYKTIMSQDDAEMIIITVCSIATDFTLTNVYNSSFRYT